MRLDVHITTYHVAAIQTRNLYSLPHLLFLRVQLIRHPYLVLRLLYIWSHQWQPDVWPVACNSANSCDLCLHLLLRRISSMPYEMMCLCLYSFLHWSSLFCWQGRMNNMVCSLMTAYNRRWIICHLTRHCIWIYEEVRCVCQLTWYVIMFAWLGIHWWITPINF